MVSQTDMTLHRELTLEEKEWLGDKVSDGITWWKEEDEVEVEDEKQADEGVSDPVPETPDTDVNALLCQLCEQNRRQTGNHSIIWRRVVHFIYLFFIYFLGLKCKSGRENC